MARKVFVSYKYGDTNVDPLPEPLKVLGTCRDYVDYLMQTIAGIEIYKGETNTADSDLSKFKDETIRSHLKEKIRDSSITVVLVSKGMKESWRPESEQWIPWEIKYSLRRGAYGERRSNSNGLLAVIIPDSDNSYSHYYEDSHCDSCNTITHKTQDLFKIMHVNMFNKKRPNKLSCSSTVHNSTYHIGNDHSYIHQVKWENFIKDPSYYLDIAQGLRERIDEFNIVKRVKAY